MSKLYLHIGTHKTGTTEIQQSLMFAKKNLANEKIIYVPYFPSSFEMMRINCLDSNMIAQCVDYLQEQTKGYSSQYRFIMSFEGFSGDLEQGYKNSRFVAQTLKEATCEFEVSVIVYLRRQDTFLESAYTQLIHQGESFSFSEFRNNYDFSSFNWLDLLNNYSEFFGKKNIILKRYDKKYLPYKKSLIENFSNIIGAESLKELELKESFNIGYDRPALEIARLCNPYLEQDEKKILRRILQSSGIKSPFNNYGYFTADERQKFLEGYKDSNAEINREYFNDTLDSLFPDNDYYEENYPGLTNEDITKILILVIKENNKIKKTDPEYLLRRIFKKIKKIISSKKTVLMANNNNVQSAKKYFD